MNLRLVIKNTSIFLMFLATTLLVPFFVALIYHEKEWISFITAILITISSGILGYVSCYYEKDAHIFKKEGFAIVGFAWIFGSFFSSLPFALSGYMGLVDAFFETVSGFTTTGATILPNIEILPKSLLFWRCFTHWLGGLGIIVLFVAIFPLISGSGGKQLFRRESAAINTEGVKPRFRDAAKGMLSVYVAFTVVETLLLLGGNMNLFDALCHTFSSIATGGFSNYNASIAYFNSVYIEAVIVVFMMIGGMNFVLLYNVFFHGILPKGKDRSEWITYISLLILATFFVMLSLHWQQPEAYSTLKHTFRAAIFTVVSIQTSTGFVIDDFDLWPPFCKVILVALQCIGSCAASTASGIKIFRFQIAFAFLRNQMFKMIHFGAVKSIKIAENVVSEETKDEVLGLFSIAFLSIFICTLLMAATGLDIVSAFTAVVTCTFNCGPGLGQVGAVESYALVSTFGKLVLSCCMILGRLEFFTILVLFSKSFWKK